MSEATTEAVSDPFSEQLSFLDVKSRLALLNHTEEAKRMGVDRRTVTNVLNGLRPWSPLIPRIARKIKVPTDLLRSYLIEMVAHRNGNKAR